MRQRNAVCGALFALCAFGCGGEAGRGKVAGKVSVGDKAATAGEIRFHGPNGAVTSARINGDGSYEIPDLSPGDMKVTVHPAGLTGRVSLPPKGTTPIDSGGTGVAPDPSKSPAVPIKYQNPDSTGLKFLVKSGDNTFDAKLTR